MLEQLIELISKVLKIPVGDLSIESSADHYAQWDSLAHMNLIFALEEEFKVTVSDEDLPNSMNIKKLLEIVENS